MTEYRNITYWENKRRLALLSRFHDLVVTYFNNSDFDQHWISETRTENQAARDARAEINLMVDEVSAIVFAAEIASHVTWTAPPALGGRSQRLDLLMNLFGLDRYQVAPNVVVDILQRSIGVYQTDRTRSLRRTVNIFGG